MRGVVLRQEDAAMAARARAAGCAVVVQAGWDIPFEQTLFAAPGLRLDEGLINAGMRWAETWDLAAPLIGPGALAAGMGGPSARERAQGLMHDLRVPLYATEMIFAQQNETARRFLEAWAEASANEDARLAFLVALYQVKPRILALPKVWILREGRVAAAPRATIAPPEPAGRQASKLVSVQIAPGKFIKCFPGEEAKILAKMKLRGMRRAARREAG